MLSSAATTSIKGVLQCARYAFSPNHYQYCGPDKNRVLFDYVSAGFYEPPLAKILSEFEVLFPYLKLIAQNNGVSDVFDRSVVQAYWLGNSLTENVNVKQLYRHFTEDKNLKSKLKKITVEKVLGLIPKRSKPHHNFHVVNIWLRAGNINIKHTLRSIDECRISWGRIKQIRPASVLAEFQHLKIADNNIGLGRPVMREVKTHFSDKTFVKNLKVNDLISIHWGWACEKISQSQLNYLKKYTLESLAVFNRQAGQFFEN